MPIPDSEAVRPYGNNPGFGVIVTNALESLNAQCVMDEHGDAIAILWAPWPGSGHVISQRPTATGPPARRRHR